MRAHIDVTEQYFIAPDQVSMKSIRTSRLIKFRRCRRSGYDNFFRPDTRLVQRRWTDSIASMSFTVYGDHAGETFSTSGCGVRTHMQEQHCDLQKHGKLLQYAGEPQQQYHKLYVPSMPRSRTDSTIGNNAPFILMFLSYFMLPIFRTQHLLIDTAIIAILQPIALAHQQQRLHDISIIQNL